MQFVFLHADPNFVYPFFTGYAQENGRDKGEGFRHNFPLATGTGNGDYLEAFEKALMVIEDFDSKFFLISLAVDIYEGDPLSTFCVTREVFGTIGRLLGDTKFPLLFVQEGGYDLEEAVNCVANVLEGVMSIHP